VFYVGLPEGTEPLGREPASILLRYSLRATWGFLREQNLQARTSQYSSQVFTKGNVGLSEGTVPEGREPASILLRYSLESTWGLLWEQNLRTGNQPVFI
jgi:hypothetical protein